MSERRYRTRVVIGVIAFQRLGHDERQVIVGVECESSSSSAATEPFSPATTPDQPVALVPVETSEHRGATPTEEKASAEVAAALSGKTGDPDLPAPTRPAISGRVFDRTGRPLAFCQRKKLEDPRQSRTRSSFITDGYSRRFPSGVEKRTMLVNASERSALRGLDTDGRSYYGLIEPGLPPRRYDVDLVPDHPEFSVARSRLDEPIDGAVLQHRSTRTRYIWSPRTERACGKAKGLHSQRAKMAPGSRQGRQDVDSSHAARHPRIT